MEEKKLATMICCVCGKEIDKNYARNTVGNYCKRCAFDRALNIQIEKDYESGAMDENIIFDVEEALKNNQDAGAYVGDLLRITHRLQSENKTLKTELRKECEEHEEFTKKAKVEILEWNKLFNEKRAEIDLHKIQNAKLEEELSSLKKTVEILTKREFDEQRKTYLCGKCQERVFEKYKEKETQICELQKQVNDWVRVHDEQLSAMQILTIENKNLKYSLDTANGYIKKLAESCETNCKKFNGITTQQAVKDTAKEILQGFDKWLNQAISDSYNKSVCGSMHHGGRNSAFHEVKELIKKVAESKGVEVE